MSSSELRTEGFSRRLWQSLIESSITAHTMAVIFNMAMIDPPEEGKVNSGVGTVRLRSPDEDMEVFCASSLSDLNWIRVEL